MIWEYCKRLDLFNKVLHTYFNPTHNVFQETAVAHDNNNNYHYVENNSWSIHFVTVCMLVAVYYLVYFLEERYSARQLSFPKIKASSNLIN